MDVRMIITTCCPFNNICEIHGDSFQECRLEDVPEVDDQPTCTNGDKIKVGGPKETLVKY